MNENSNHIGKKSWRKLSLKQQRRIIEDRANGRAAFKQIRAIDAAVKPEVEG